MLKHLTLMTASLTFTPKGIQLKAGTESLMDYRWVIFIFGTFVQEILKIFKENRGVFGFNFHFNVEWIRHFPEADENLTWRKYKIQANLNLIKVNCECFLHAIEEMRYTTWLWFWCGKLMLNATLIQFSFIQVSHTFSQHMTQTGIPP